MFCDTNTLGVNVYKPFKCDKTKYPIAMYKVSKKMKILGIKGH